jgi:hypothetical protein
MSGKDKSPPPDTFMPAMPLITADAPSEQTEEVIAGVMADLERDYQLLSRRRREAVDVTYRLPTGPPPAVLPEEGTEEVIAGVISHIDDVFDQAVEAAAPAVPTADPTADPAADPTVDPTADAPAVSPADPAAPARPPAPERPSDGALRRLAWLVDAPAFLDADAVGRLYRAVGAHLAAGPESAARLSGLPGYRWLAAHLSGGADSAEGQLAAALARYLTRGWPLLSGALPDRELEPDWLTGADLGPPRPLVLLELRPGATLMPAAAGLPDGRRALGAGLFQSSELGALPRFPTPRAAAGSLDALDRAGREPDELAAMVDQRCRWQREQYWAALRPRYQPEVAAAALDIAGPLRWLDVRLPVSNHGHTLTLHLRGDLDPGELARAIFNRGYDCGLRLIGALHAGGVVNVLALYEI